MSDLSDLHRGRLERLAAFLETVPPERFSFDAWAQPNPRDPRGVLNLDLASPNCGTVACGLGWATAMPEFQELGLSLAIRGGEWNSRRVATVGIRHVDGAGEEYWTTPMKAAEEIFGLTPDEFGMLFVPGEVEDDDDEVDPSRLPEDATAKDLAEHIRAFLRGEFE